MAGHLRIEVRGRSGVQRVHELIDRGWAVRLLELGNNSYGDNEDRFLIFHLQRGVNLTLENEVPTLKSEG